jgi:hypothetical protein
MSSNVQIVQSFYDDISNFIDTLHADIEWHEMQGIRYGGVYRVRRAYGWRAAGILEGTKSVSTESTRFMSSRSPTM